MRYGCCTGDAQAAGLLATLGYDYFELPLANLAALPEDEFAALAEGIERSGIHSEACNIFFPRTVRLTGDDVDPARIEAYTAHAIGRAARLGTRIIVFGSGGARNIPEGFPAGHAWDQLVEALRLVAPIAQAHDITIVIEPLNRRESNIINTAAEGLALARQVDRPSIRLLVDYYHLTLEHESPQILLEARDYVKHVHFRARRGPCLSAVGRRRIPALLRQPESHRLRRADQH